MKIHRSRKSLPLVALVAALALSAFAGSAHANTPPAAPPPVTAPATPPALPAPAPAAPPVARKPEEETPTPAPAPAAETRPNIFARAASYMQSRDSMAATLAERDGRIATLTAQLATASATISAQNVELAELRAGRASLETAMQTLQDGIAGALERALAEYHPPERPGPWEPKIDDVLEFVYLDVTYSPVYPNDSSMPVTVQKCEDGTDPSRPCRHA